MIYPMLAHKYAPKKVTYPCFVQPKLNGVRGIFLPQGQFQSRGGETWNTPVVQHALSSLTALKFFLDGEFYKHGMSLQNINSRIGVKNNNAHAESHLIQFCIFDVMVDAPFWRRALILNTLKKRLSESTSVRIVKTREVVSETEADYFYNQWKNHEGFEGMMYRDANAVYGFKSRCGNQENRWNCLLKRKEMVDMEATIVGFNEMICGTTGEPKGTLGSFDLQTPLGVTFSAGSGLTNELRDKFWAIGPDAMYGVKVRVNYEMLSDGGTPLKPIIDLVDFTV